MRKFHSFLRGTTRSPISRVPTSSLSRRVGRRPSSLGWHRVTRVTQDVVGAHKGSCDVVGWTP